jgi:hypothetical protein
MIFGKIKRKLKMSNQESFHFANKASVDKLITALENVMEQDENAANQKTNNNAIDKNLTHKVILLLTKISGLDDLIRNYLDELSIDTRNNIDMPRPLNSFLDQSQDFMLNHILTFMACIFSEISYGLYKKSPAGNAYANELKEILPKVNEYYEAFLASPKQTLENKNRVRYNVGFLQFHETQKLRDETIELYNKCQKIVQDAQEIIPKKISEVLKENSEALSNNFNRLLEKKVKEENRTFKFLFGMGAITLAVPFFMWYLFPTVIPGNVSPPYDYFVWVFQLISAGAIEGLLIYFYRIVLHDYNKIKTEIIQLEIREALSNFLPSYVAYVSSNDKNPVLEHFSNFIFKPLVSNAADIPKITDGFDAIVNLVNKLKN